LVERHAHRGDNAGDERLITAVLSEPPGISPYTWPDPRRSRGLRTRAPPQAGHRRPAVGPRTAR